MSRRVLHCSLSTLILCGQISCGRKSTSAPEQGDADATAIPLAIGAKVAWEAYLLFSAAAGAVVAINLSSGEEVTFESLAAAQRTLERQGGKIVTHFKAETAPNALARPVSKASGVPATISHSCPNQKRPEEGSCAEDACYLSPGSKNAMEARRIVSNQMDSKSTCFVYKWGDSPTGFDKAHGWLPHYHLYETSRNGKCIRNIHFYFSNATDFAKYKGRCKKY